jgi:putative membrane-bound dehydrogenase-like protein
MRLLRLIPAALFCLATFNLHAKRPDAPLPPGVTLKDAAGHDNGIRFVDLNGDGFDDIVFSNAEHYGVYLYNDVERKNLGWTIGWPHLIREGKAGDANALPLTTGDDVEFKDGAMWVKGARVMSYEELCRPPAPPARTPEDSLKAMHLKPGFNAELVAQEPLVQDPIYVDWDAQGRMWVVEMADYPFHEHNGKTYHGRVKVLEDTDEDGIYDKATVFLDDLTYPTGLTPWKNGVFVASVPDVFFAEDTDGDGKADKRTTILQGFKEGNPQHLVNGFSWGLDGWFYGGNGDSGGIVTEVRTGNKFDLSGRDFRFNPKTGEFQLQPGRAQYGRWRDDFGNWFANNNSNLGWHYFLSDRYLARNPNLAVPTLRHDLNPGGKTLYPVSAPVRRLNNPDAVNLLTSGCNPIPYRDTLFGAAFASSLFICEPANNLVHREVLEPDGVTFTSHRGEGEANSEFLASEDNWSRFTQARTGPDGCLYVVDFYRLILEHPEWIPTQMIEHLDLRGGSDRGRIYRIRPVKPRPRTVPRLAYMPDDAIAKELDSPNGWTRDAAERLLVERESKWSRDSVSGSPAARIQQLWTMETLGTLKPALLRTVLKDKDARVREHAVRLAESHFDDQAVLQAVCELAKDAELRVRVQVAFSLGESKDGRVPEVLGNLAKADAGTPAMLVAALSSAPDHPDAAHWQTLLKDAQKVGGGAAAAKIITNSNPDRDKVVKSYAGAAKLTGDPEKGHVLYTTICSVCHRLKNEGNEIGPDLGTIAGKPTEQLLEAILDPNRAVEQRYLTHTVTLKDGRQLVGMVAEETGNSITLKLGATTEVLLRSQVAKSESGTRSLMPDGLETLLNQQQVADVLAWIRAK